MNAQFEGLIEEARAHDFSGWDFSFMDGRFILEPLPWSYGGRVSELATTAATMLDIGTGGGEFLSGLSRRAPLTVGAEGWIPNVGIAANTLRTVGVPVVQIEDAVDNIDYATTKPTGPLPFRNDVFDLVVNRHSSFDGREVARTLRGGGTFITQQVGGRNEAELGTAMGYATPQRSPTLDDYRAQFEHAGLEVVTAAEAFARKRYLDVGAIAYQLSAIPWMFEGLVVDDAALRTIHEHIVEYGGFDTFHHRLLFVVRKP